MIKNHIYNCDCLAGLQTLPNESVNCCVTSPPYFGLRDYGAAGQLGLESTPQAYVKKLVAVFREVKRVLRNDGTLWLNLGDSYAGSGKGAWANKDGGQKEVYIPDPESPQCKIQKIPTGLKQKDLIGIPWRVAFALQADGWYLRSDIIWHKPNPMPEPVTDRCTKAHEYIFLLSKQPKYYFDSDAIRQPLAESTKDRGPVDFGGRKGREYDPKSGDPNFRNGYEQWGRTYNYEESNSDGKCNKRDVWIVATKPCKEAHFATFPPELIRPCVLAGSPRGGIILDTFMGAGTTALVALQEGRQYIGFELNPKYIEIANKRLSKVQVNLLSGG